MTRLLRTPKRLAVALALALAVASQPALAQTRALPSSEPTNEPKTPKQLEAQQHFQRAKDLYLQGSYREAIAELDAARALDPKAKDLVFNLGIVHERLGNFDEAIAAFQKYEQMDDVTAAEKTRAETSIKRIEGAKREAAARTPKTADPKIEPPPAPPDEEHGRIDAATIGVGAIAVAGLGVGTVFGIVALSTKPKSGFVTGQDGSYSDLQDKTDKAHTDAIVSDIGFGVGIVAAAVTAYLFFGRTKEPTPKTAKRALSFTPAFSTSGGGASIGGAF